MLVIKNWNTHFETAQSRKVSNLTWVAIPNNLNSRGYRKIMKHPDRAKVFAAWIILIEIASNSTTRGQLGDEDGPYTTEDLELYSDFPKENFEIAIPFLKEIGWVCEQVGSELVARSEHAPSTLVDTVQDSTEQNNNISNKKSKYSSVYGNEIWVYRTDVEEAWEYVPRGKKKFKTKFEKNWISYVIYENVDKLLVFKKFVEYYESEEGTSKYFREAFRLIEDEFWDEDRAVWGKDRGNKKFPDSVFDQEKIVESFLKANPENKQLFVEAIEKAKNKGRGVGALAIKIWNKYPEHRI